MNTYTIVTTDGYVIVVHFNSMNELRHYMKEEEINPSVITVN